MSVSYSFVPLAVSDAQRAWQEFVGENPPRELCESVSFIPAQGGSFLVAEAKQRAGWLATLAHTPFGANPAVSALEEFGSYLVARR